MTAELFAEADRVDVRENARRDVRQPARDGARAVARLLAGAVTLVLLMVRWPIVVMLNATRAFADRLRFARWLLQRPFTVALASSVCGALMAIAWQPSLSVPGSIARFTLTLACSLLMIVATARLFDTVGDPFSAPVARIPLMLRAYYARAGRHQLDAAWLEVLLVSALLVAAPLAALLVRPGLRIETALLFGATLWAVRKPLVDFEHGNSHYAFLRSGPGAGRGDRAALRIVDWLARYPFALITARIPNWYAVQHVAVHHAENNGLDDNQSTARYDRASFSGFAACLQRFAASGLLPVDVALYLRAKRRRKALRRLAVGYAAYLSFLLVLGIHDPATVVVFVLIRYVGLLADGASFFQEHGLLDPEHPDEVVTNSLHYINRDNEHGSRGEDLHIEHHRSPGVHWTRYPERADFHRDEYERLHAIGFHDGPDQLETYYRCLWRQDFAELSTHVHVFGGERLGTGELVRLLRHRTAPAGRDRLPISALEAGVGKLAAHLI